ncbi:MAG: Lrp/AsnC ligand binding domain-containing protein [Nanoarchaeota archaeon]
MHAYILIALEGANEQEVYDKMKKLKHVSDIHILFGEWDVLIEVDVASSEALGDFVMKYIRSMPEVKLTSTMVVAK